MAEKNDNVPSIPLPPTGSGVPPVEPPPAAPPAPTAPPAAPGAPQPLPPVTQPDPYAAPGSAPNPYAQPVAGYAAPPAAYAYAPAGPAQGLSIASMILGIAAVLLAFGSLGFLPGLAAVICGHLAQKRQPYARPFWLTGLITGYIALGISVVWGFIFVAAFISGIVGSSYNY